MSGSIASLNLNQSRTRSNSFRLWIFTSLLPCFITSALNQKSPGTLPGLLTLLYAHKYTTELLNVKRNIRPLLKFI